MRLVDDAWEIRRCPIFPLARLIGIFLVAFSNPAWGQAMAPLPPSFEKFQDCEFSNDPDPFTSIQICSLPFKDSRNQVGVAVDGDKSKRNFGWTLSKLTKVDEEGSATLYIVSQFAYDCKTGKGISRSVLEAINIVGVGLRPLSEKTDKYMRWGPWTTPSAKSLEVLKEGCPNQEPGLTRIGELRFQLNQTLRRGDIVNVRAVDSGGREVVFSFDCRSLTFGVNSKPVSPIKPGSVAGEVYKRICR